MAISVFDLFKIGIGPSSSHTVGPMRAARLFVLRLAYDGLMERTARVHSQLYGSLGAIGKGHGNVIQYCVKRGSATDGVLPGGFKVKRRAAPLYRDLTANPEAALKDPLTPRAWRCAAMARTM